MEDKKYEPRRAATGGDASFESLNFGSRILMRYRRPDYVKLGKTKKRRRVANHPSPLEFLRRCLGRAIKKLEMVREEKVTKVSNIVCVYFQRS